MGALNFPTMSRLKSVITTSALLPRMISPERTNGEKCFCCLWQSLPCLSFFSLSHWYRRLFIGSFLKDYVAHIIYIWTMSHDTEISFLFKNGKYFLSYDSDTTVFFGVPHRWNFEYFNLEHIPILFIVTDNFSSHHRLFIIIHHLQWYYAQYTPFFYFCPILINSHLMKNKMDFTNDNFSCFLFFSNMEVIPWWTWFYSMMCHF